MTQELSVTLTNEMADLGRLPAQLEAFAEQAGLPPDVVMHIDIVLDELLANTISYGYPDGRTGTIRLNIRAADDEVRIFIEDDGDAFDPLSLAAPDLEAELEDRQIGGLGVHFARTMMDQVDYQRTEGLNRITLIKQLSRSGQHHDT